MNSRSYPLDRRPRRDPPLQGAPQPIGIAAALAALQPALYRRRTQTWDRLQHRHELFAPDLDEEGLPRSIEPRAIPLAWQDRCRVDAATGALAEPAAA